MPAGHGRDTNRDTSGTMGARPGHRRDLSRETSWDTSGAMAGTLLDQAGTPRRDTRNRVWWASLFEAPGRSGGRRRAASSTRPSPPGLAPSLMDGVRVCWQSELILSGPSEYWISVINAGRRTSLDMIRNALAPGDSLENASQVIEITPHQSMAQQQHSAAHHTANR